MPFCPGQRDLAAAMRAATLTTKLISRDVELAAAMNADDFQEWAVVSGQLALKVPTLPLSNQLRRISTLLLLLQHQVDAHHGAEDQLPHRMVGRNGGGNLQHIVVGAGEQLFS